MGYVQKEERGVLNIEQDGVHQPWPEQGGGHMDVGLSAHQDRGATAGPRPGESHQDGSPVGEGRRRS